jgi:leader peptidase (prepilin peptidase) / N-methyltransferase
MITDPRHQNVTKLLASLMLPPPKAGIALFSGGLLAAVGALAAPAHQYEAVLLGFALSWAAMVDIERFILPDLITLGLVVVGLCSALSGDSSALLARAIGAGVGYAFLAALAALYVRVRHRDGLGLGDAKLAAAAGAWLGWAALPFVMLLASGAGLAYFFLWRAGSEKSLHRPVAFGPFIACGFWVTWLASASNYVALSTG